MDEDEEVNKPGPSNRPKRKRYFEAKDDSKMWDEPDNDNEGNNDEQTGDIFPLDSVFSLSTPKLNEGIKLSDQRNFDAPLPKLPRQAHYNRCDEVENLKYLKEREKIETTIPDLKEETDSEEEDDNDQQSGKNKRYFSNIQVYSKFDFKYRKIDTSKLAVNAHKGVIIDAIDKNRVLIIHGFTGCGKTTQVPQFIMDKFVSENKMRCNIVVTQPRRLAALTVARRVSEERGWNIGTVVGYQIGMDKCVKRDDTLITYVTTGVLLQKLINTKTLQPYTHIVIDEVHERDLDTDLLLLVIKKILQQDTEGVERNVKLVLMSATIDTKLFSEYFTVSDENQMKRTTPVVHITQARTYKVTEYFLEDQTNSEGVKNIEANLDETRATFNEEICQIAINTIRSFDDKEKMDTKDPRMQMNKRLYADKQDELVRNSVLVFLPGFVEIDMMRKLMERTAAEEKETNKKELNWTIICLHSSISHDEQGKVFDPPQKSYRKVILSTNIAESSITVPDVVYVIDFCLTKSNVVDARTNFNCLRMVWASRNQTIQRKGRAGRVRDGKAYKMIPKDFMKKLKQNSPPEMQTASLEFVILKIKELNMGRVRDVISLAIDPPELNLIERAVVNLKEIGALTILTTNSDGVQTFCNDDGDLTYMGKIMNNLPIPYNCTRLIILGSIFGVTRECMIIAAGLSVKPVFNSPINKRIESYMNKLEWAKSSFSDCFAILNLYREWKSKFNDTGTGETGYFARDIRNSERVWRQLNNCSTNVLKEIHAQIDQLQDRLKQFNITNIGLQRDFYTEDLDNEKMTATKGVKIKIAIAGAFYPNYFVRPRPNRDYEKERSREVSGHDLFNTVYLKNFDDSHHGPLYAEHIAKGISFGGLGSTKVKFERSKVLALIDPKEKKIGPVNIGVYKAVKMRLCQEPVEFNVLRPQQEREIVEIETKRLKNLVYNRYIGHCELPSLETKEIFAKVSHVVNPSQFWVVEIKYEKLILEITQNANDPNMRLQPLPRSQMLLNCLCLALFENYFYRAQIKSINYIKMTARMFFVDYGNTEDIKLTALKTFSPALCQLNYDKMPGYAIECRLSEINPSVLHNSVWTEDAKSVFKRLSSDSDVSLKIEVHCVVRSVVYGRLFIKNSKGDILNMNDHLVKLDFAERANEPYIAEHNISARRRIHLIRTKEEIIQHNVRQRDEQEEMNFITPPTDAPIRITLKGPWSPLEIDFNSLCQSSVSKGVSIDQLSVNSVILDHEPTAPTSRLLIAASISIQDKSGRISARDTTLMPAIPGLLPLMAMIFCPKIELRTDKYYSMYSGVLCGVGVNPERVDVPESIYPDHDIEIVFDTEFDDDDINSINEIRHLMNLILREDSVLNLSSLNKDIQYKTMKLLKRQRVRLKEEVWPTDGYVWNRVRTDYLVPSPHEKDSRPNDIFTLHSTIKLNTEEYGDGEWTFGY